VSTLAVLALALAVEPAAAPPHPATTPACEDRLVAYAPLGEHARARITLERPPPAATAPVEAGERRESPQGTRWLFAAEPDTTRPGPWTTVLSVRGYPTGAELLRITLRDHGGYGVRTAWLNEKLLFVQAWWGRIASSDLVIDVERGVLLTGEDADLAALLGPCEPRAATR
jgi:hypothetical protein